MLEKLVAPSILSANFGHLQEDVDSVASADWLHCDIMDGQFVPNLTFGAPVIGAIQTKLVKDVHLMTETPWKLIDDFVKAGAEYITFHTEACTEEMPAEKVIKLIHAKGIKAGISLRPKTPVEEIEDVLPLVDLVLIMSVEPGFGGQSFMPEVLDKVHRVREKYPNLNISIDGGINEETGELARKAGTNILVAGSYIFKSKDRTYTIETVR